MSFFLRTASTIVAGFLLFLCQLRVAAQTAPQASSAAKVYTLVEQMPQLPGGGGSTAIVMLIQQHVRYPRHAELARAEGRVFVGFTVAASGQVEDVGVVKGFRPDCDSSVVEAVKQLPRFEPGRQAGRAVPVRFTMPVTFRLQAPEPPQQQTLNDSTRVYTSVEHMPLYKGEAGTKQLTKDFTQEFRAASEAAGCPLPKANVYVSLTVGPSGVIYDVEQVKNMAAAVLGITTGAATSPNAPGASPQPVPAACEPVLLNAARKLPRFTPGSLNGRRVAVNYLLILRPPFK